MVTRYMENPFDDEGWREFIRRNLPSKHMRWDNAGRKIFDQDITNMRRFTFFFTSFLENNGANKMYE